MDEHNAHRPTVGAVDRADDRAGELIEGHRTADIDAHEVCADPHAARALKWHRLGVALRHVAVELALLADELADDDEAVVRQ